MNKDERILFRNMEFGARVESRSNAMAKCTPFAYSGNARCGVGVSFEDGTIQTWGIQRPCDIVASWRATEMLRYLDVIEANTLRSVWHAGRRCLCQSDMPYVDWAIAKLGRGNYETIRAMAVPSTIVRAILDNRNDDHGAPLYLITFEVQAGTIEWRKEFSELGVDHPDVIKSWNDEMGWI